MKNALKISLLANVLLAGVAIWLARRSGFAGAPAASPGTNETIAEVPSPRPETGSPTQAPFHWSRLESTDYRTYVANLRGIGCPEQTVRDIITADVHGLFDRRREELHRHPPARPLEVELLRLDGEEKAVIVTLLGPAANDGAPEQVAAAGVQGRLAVGSGAAPAGSLSPTLPAISLPGTSLPAGYTTTASLPAATLSGAFAPARTAHAAATPAATSAAAPVAAPTMPVAWKQFDPAAISLSSSEVGAINNAQQLFQQQVTGADLDPSDPLYLTLWQESQMTADDWLAAQLGQPRFDELKSLAAHTTQTATGQ